MYAPSVPPSATPGPFVRQRVLWIAAWFAGTRLWSYAFMVLGSHWQLPQERYAFWAGQAADGLWYQHVPNRWLDVFGRWDSMYYVDIATRGYPPPPPEGGIAFSAAFFPLVPSLMRGLSELIPPLTPFAAGILLSNLLFFAALVYLERLVRLDASERAARAVVVALLVFPTSHFFSVVYSEATALALTVLALYAVRTARPGLASVACGLGLWARPTGWVTCVAVALELLRDDADLGGRRGEGADAVEPELVEGSVAPRTLHGLRAKGADAARPELVEGSADPRTPRDGLRARGLSPRYRLRRRLAWLLVPALALAGVLALNLANLGEPLAFLHVQSVWGRSSSFPLSSFLDTRRSLDHHLFALFGLGLFALAVKQRERLSLLVFGALNLLVPLSTGSIQSMPRFVPGNLPLPLALSRAVDARPRLRALAVGAGLALLAVYSFRWGAALQPN